MSFFGKYPFLAIFTKAFEPVSAIISMKNSLNNIRYSIFSYFYDPALYWFYNKLVKQLMESVNAHSSENVLEVGIGTGISIPYYAKNKKVTAIDCSGSMLKKAKIKAKLYPDLELELVEEDAGNSHLFANKFDQVIFCNSLSVIRDPGTVLGNYFLGLKDGGSIYILNHFTPENGWLRRMDVLLKPVGKILGFKSYFPLKNVLGTNLLQRTEIILDGYWSIVKIKKETYKNEFN